MKIKTFLMCLISTFHSYIYVDSFDPHFFSETHLNHLNHLNHLTHFPILPKNHLDQIQNIQSNNPFFLPRLKVPQSLAHQIIRTTSNKLSSVDSIGHHVLQANAHIINVILDLEISESLKKKLILKTVELSRNGDQIGSHILGLYYNSINKLL